MRLQYALPPGELRQAKAKLAEVQKEINAVVSNHRYDSSISELEERQEALKEEIEALELDWNSKRESMARIGPATSSTTGLPRAS